MKNCLISALTALALLCAPLLSLAATVPGKDGNGATKYWQTNGDGSSGNPYVQHMILSDGVNTANLQTSGADAGSNTASRLAVSSWLQGYNGTTWDRVRTGLTSAASSLTGYLNVLPFAQYNSTPPTLTNGQSVLLQVNASGALKVDPSGVTLPVSGTFWQATQPISAASLPLPTGAATAAKQPAIGAVGSASSDILTVQGIAGMTALKVDGSEATQPVTGTVTAIVRGGAKGSTSAADVTSTASGSNHQPLDVVIYDTSGNPITSFGGGSGGTSSSFGSSFPSTGTAIGASDGTNMQGLLLESSSNKNLRVGLFNGSNQASVSAGGAVKVDGSAVTQPVSGTFWQATQPVSGTVTATLSSSTNAGATVKTADYDTGGGTDTVTGFGVLLPKSGGAVAGGTSSDPLRIDPTGTTAQPVTDNGGSLTVDGSVSIGSALPAGTNNIGDVDIASAIPAGTNNIGDVDIASAIPAGTNYIGKTRLTDGTNDVTLKSLTNAKAVPTAIVDGNGDQITSFGGGTQYTEGDTDATITGTAALWEDSSNTLTTVSSSKPLPVNVVAGGGSGGTSSSFGSSFPSTGTAIGATDGTNMQALKVDGSQNLLVKINAGGATQPVSLAAGAAAIAKAEDVASADADVGVPALAVRKATPANTSGTDGDYESLQMSAGRLWTSATIDAALPAGSNVIGALSANQSVNVAQLAGTTTDTNSGSKSAGTLRVVIATDQPQLTNKLLVTPDANSAVNLAQVGGNTVNTGTGNAGTGTARVVLASDQPVVATGGNVAHDAADSGNPVKQGFRAVNAELTAVANNDRVDGIADLVGKHIVLPYANPENFIVGSTSDITGTSNTAVIAAQGSGVRIYVTQVTVTNSHASTGTWVNIKDGTSTIYTGYAAAAGGGFTITFPVPLRLTANTALNAANETTSSNTRVSASGYKGS